MIYVSAAIIRNEQGEILICRRGAGGVCAYLWEFPGGKREEHETAQMCLIRECKEELDILIGVEKLFAQTTYAYPDREIAFDFFDCKILSGAAKPKIHQEIKWVYPGELDAESFCPADVLIVQKLKNDH